MNTNNKENNNITGVIRTTNNKQHQHFGSSLFEQLVQTSGSVFRTIGLDKQFEDWVRKKWSEQVV